MSEMNEHMTREELARARDTTRQTVQSRLKDMTNKMVYPFGRARTVWADIEFFDDDVTRNEIVLYNLEISMRSRELDRSVLRAVLQQFFPSFLDQEDSILAELPKCEGSMGSFMLCIRKVLQRRGANAASKF